jgi:hypothetical protein
MKITQGVREYAAQKEIDEHAALGVGMKSKWVLKELSIAREKNLKIYPVVSGAVELPENLQDIMYVKMDDSYDETISALEQAIRQSGLRRQEM